jgi:hypothetical protein
MKRLIPLLLLTLAFAGFHTLPAHAQATRTWVSGVGDEANPCSRTAPCKTFAGAISKTGTGGEINCLDPAGFGSVTITNAITILCDGVSNGGVLVSGTDGIVVAAPAGSAVVLSGLDFEGLGSGLNGVNITGGMVTIRNSIIRDFVTAGVTLNAATQSPIPLLVIQNTQIINNHVGLNVPASAANFAEVFNSLILGIKGADILVSGPSTVVLSGSVVSRSGGTAGAAISVSGGGSVISYGNNVLRGIGTPTSTLPLQ